MWTPPWGVNGQVEGFAYGELPSVVVYCSDIWREILSGVTVGEGERPYAVQPAATALTALTL